MFGGTVREDYLIAMLGCQVVFVSAVRESELSTKVLEVRDVYCGPMGTRRDSEKEAGQWTWGSAKFCIGAELVNPDRVVQDEMVQILVKSSAGYSLVLRMRMDSLVEHLRARIHDRDGVRPVRQLLECAGKLMEDGHRLSDYPLRSGCAVHMRLKESEDVFAKWKLRTQFGENPVDILVWTPLQTTGNLDGGMNSFIKHRLLRAQRVGKGARQTSVVQTRRSMQIFVRTVLGKVITPDVNPSDTIDMVKHQILDKKRIPCDEQNLVYVSR